MRTFECVCKTDYEVWDSRDGGRMVLKLERGKKYLTSRIKDGKVTVFTHVWAEVPNKIFGWKKLFTK
jgi:hypothetical protein